MKCVYGVFESVVSWPSTPPSPMTSPIVTLSQVPGLEQIFRSDWLNDQNKVETKKIEISNDWETNSTEIVVDCVSTQWRHFPCGGQNKREQRISIAMIISFVILGFPSSPNVAFTHWIASDTYSEHETWIREIQFNVRHTIMSEYACALDATTHFLQYLFSIFENNCRTTTTTMPEPVNSNVESGQCYKLMT